MSTEKPAMKRPGIASWLRELDLLLRGDLTRVSSLRRGGLELNSGRLSLIIIVLAMIYGVCMGTFAVFRSQGADPVQMLASMLKVPLLFYLTLLVTFPSLYVFNALVGSRLGLVTVVRLLVASLGVMVAVLSSLGPIVAFFSVTTSSYPFMLLFNVVVFTVAGTLGMAFLLQTLHRLSVVDSQPLAPSPRSAEAEPESLFAVDEPSGALDPLENRVLSQHVKTVFRLWVIVFALVGAQMGWVLRPFVGSPHSPFTWLRPRDSNFFQAVFRTFQSLFS
jgi:hypothetical protein